MIALSISTEKNREILLKQFFSESESIEKEFEKIMLNLLQKSPNFIHSIFQKYVKAFCENRIKELLPFELSKLKEISDDSLIIQKEIISAFAKLSKQDKEKTIEFLENIS